MTRNSVWMLAAAMATSTGCLTTGSGGFGDDDQQTDADADIDADSDADTDVDTGSDTGPACPDYPAGPFGWYPGDVLNNFSLPGNGPENDTWTMNDFFCMAHEAENPATALLINIHSMT